MKVFKCDICSKYFETNEDMKTHVKHKHQIKSDTRLFLKKYDELVSNIVKQKIKLYGNLYKLKQKEEKEKGNCFCKRRVCNIDHARFRWRASKSDNLFNKVTEIIPSDETVSKTKKPSGNYKCPECDHGFEEEVKIKKHIEMHNDTCASSKCQQCDYFIQKDEDIQSHIKQVHVQKIMCKRCDQTFTNKQGLLVHIETDHTKTIKNSGPEYRCRLCEEQFEEEENLKTLNDLSHKSRFVYPCNLCDITFGEEELFQCHIK